MDKNERLIKVTDELRTFAKEENVCVVMLYHTAKPPERDINRIPTMFDVRDATEITDNSHIILLPFREVMSEKLLGDEALPSNLAINDWTGSAT
jgi:replicative DNA helicase